MKLTLTIPETLKEITLNQYQQWLKVAEDKEMTDFLKQKMIEIFCGITLNQVLQIKATDVDEIVNDLSKLFKQDTSLINKFTLEGVEYGFEPKIDEITFGAYVDLDTYMADWQQMHKAMSVLFRPVTFTKKKKKWYNFLMWWSINEDQYLIKEYASANKYDLKEMTLDVVFGSLVFFWRLRNELQKHILSFLANQSGITLPPEMKASLLNGIGTTQSLPFQVETS
tara:strand:+ start:178 stop:852 length:675 start_codon:yes stop_codon:yes gene_type:complete